MTRLNLNDARCEALFASGLQRSQHPTAEAAAEAVSRAVRQFGIRGCASQMAQEFGDHPQAAAERMRWARLVVAEMTPRPRSSSEPHAPVPRPGAAGRPVPRCVRACGGRRRKHRPARDTVNSTCACAARTGIGRCCPPGLEYRSRLRDLPADRGLHSGRSLTGTG
jgi:hypothetical protein